VEIEPDSQKRFKCQMLRQAGQFPKSPSGKFMMDNNIW
jgi:hypothetical protein